MAIDIPVIAAAWNSGSSEAVAKVHARNGTIVINRGTPWEGHAGNHVAYLWTFTGHHAQTRIHLLINGWEEWDFDAEGKVIASRGWYDAGEYARQVAG